MPASAPEVDSKINLDDIVNLSEDEFKRQIAIWIEERGISKALQSKLRADLFDHFNRTNLGRRIALKHHQNAHRLILSPLLLALNTLVAEFLYSEDCHFSLSVFATEVPFRNTLPDFESSPRTIFRFTETELTAIFEAIKCVPTHKESDIRRFYMDKDEIASATNTSLLYCIFRGLVDMRHEGNATAPTILADINRRDPNDATVRRPSGLNATASDDNRDKRQSNTPQCSKCYKINPDNLQINARYFKYLNRYLDILSDRVNEMSESLARIHTTNRPLTTAANRASSNSQHLEHGIKVNINKMQEHLADLSKSKKKQKKLQDVINSVEKLSSNLEKCSDNLHNLLLVTNAATTNGTKMQQFAEKSSDTISTNPQKAISAPTEYSIWLREMKMSENGKKFIARMETSLQKTLDREKEYLNKLFDEKMENYRILVKLHYKQKYSALNVTAASNVVPQDSSNEAQLGKTSNAKPMTSILKDTLQQSALNDEKQLVHLKRCEKQRHVENIVTTSKLRLKELEHESQKLDESFRAYLKRQNLEKTQFNEDIAKILQNYNMRKAMLGQHIPCQRRLSFNFERNVTYPLTCPSDPVETNENVATAIDIPDFDEHFENPFRTFNTNSILKTSSPLKSPQLIQTIIVEPMTTNVPAHGTQTIVTGTVTNVISKPTEQMPNVTGKSNGIIVRDDEMISFARAVNESHEEINLDLKSLPNGPSLLNGHGKNDKVNDKDDIKNKDMSNVLVRLDTPNDIHNTDKNGVLTIHSALDAFTHGNHHEGDENNMHMENVTKPPKQTLLKLNSMKHFKKPMSMTSSGESESPSDEQISTGPPKSPSPVDSW